MSLLTALCAVCMCLSILLPSISATTLTVNLNGLGKVVGNVNPQGTVASFLGVPFALPPTNDRRFRPPAPVGPWSEPLMASAVKPSCPQLRLIGNDSLSKDWSEDCLYLDLYVPLSNGGLPHDVPTMEFIHGGGFIIGDAFHKGELNGTSLAATYNVIVASLAYRLDVLGFLSTRATLNESGTTGNYGLQDQRMGMAFVHTHIESFGGNPSRITLFGQSAGAFSVAAHLSAPASAGLFSAAILESGTSASPSFFPSLEHAVEFGEGITADLGCNVTELGDAAYLKCLRSKPVLDLFAPIDTWIAHTWPKKGSPPLGWKSVLAPVMAWGPAVDGTELGLPMRPLEAVQAGKWNNVPVISGTNTDEGTLFEPVFPLVFNATYPIKEWGVANLLAHMGATPDVAATAMNKLYPLSAFDNDPSKQVDHMVRDLCLACPTRSLVRAISDDGKVPSYLYRWTFVPPLPNLLGSFHSAEIRYVWNTPKPGKTFDAEEQEVSKTIQRFWVNFAYSNGNPNTPAPTTGSPAPVNWPVYTAAADSGVYLNETVSPLVHLSKTACDYWDAQPVQYC